MRRQMPTPSARLPIRGFIFGSTPRARCTSSTVLADRVWTRRMWTVLRTFILALTLSVNSPAVAQVTGISYTAAPLAERVYFDKNAGLEDGTFAGGRIGFGFGEYTELSAIYLISSGLSTDFSEFAALGSGFEDRFDLLPTRDVNARLYGAELKFNLGRQTVFPYISLGTGILHFDPENLDESRHIYLLGAAGLQVAFGDHFALLAHVEDLIYRYNPANSLLSQGDLSDLGVDATDFEQVNVNNLAIRVGLQMYLGGRARGELTDADLALRRQLSRGLSGIRLQIEPIGGIINFHEDLGFRDHQRMAGVLAGLDLGPFLGLRGFYWRGVQEDSYTDFDNLQAYGGEIRLRFGTIANRLIPHLIIGGGYLDVLSGYEGNGEMDPVDRPFASGGVGVNIPFTDAIQAHAGVRSLLISTDDAENVSDPSQITANLLYGAGIRFGLGGGGAEPRVPPARPRIPPTAEVEPTELETEPTGLEAELARMRAQIDSLQMALDRPPGVDRDVIQPQTREDEEFQIVQGEEWISIPVPAEGEFYVRYGDSGGQSRFGASSPGVIYVDPETGEVVGAQQAGASAGMQEAVGVAGAQGAEDAALSAQDIREIVRETMRRELQGQAAPEQESETVRRLRSRIEELEDRLQDLRDTGNLREDFDDDGDGFNGVSTARRDPDRAGYELQRIIPFVGFGLSEDNLGVAGLRAELRSRSLAGLRFLPEIVASAGADGVSYGLNAGAGFPLGFETSSLRPYAGVGLGLVTLNGVELVFNVFGGVEQTGYRGRFFAEYMSQDFFDLNRFIFGYRLSI